MRTPHLLCAHKKFGEGFRINERWLSRGQEDYDVIFYHDDPADQGDGLEGAPGDPQSGQLDFIEDEEDSSDSSEEPEDVGSPGSGDPHAGYLMTLHNG
jgi:hypothetical protein